MNNSKKTSTTFIIVLLTMLLSFCFSAAVLSLMGFSIPLDGRAFLFAFTVSLAIAFARACSSMNVGEVMLTLLSVILLADGVGIIGFSILSAEYMTALFLIPLVIVSFFLLSIAFSASRGRASGRRRRGTPLLVFSLMLLAAVGFLIVYFHAERLVTLKEIQSMKAVEAFDFRRILSAFEVGFDLNRTILVIALALSSLAALVSSVRHKGRGYGTLAFLLGLFIFDGIGICWFAFRTGDYLTGTFLIPLMMVAFSLVIGYVVHRVSGWTPDGNLLGKALLAFALVFLAVFMVAIGFYYVKSNTMPDEVFLNHEMPTPKAVEFGAAESFGKGSLAIPTVIALVTAFFLFIATKLSEAPYRKSANEIPWQILLMIEGLVLSSTFITIGCSAYGILGPILLGAAVSFTISALRRKRERQSSRAFIAFYLVFLISFVGGLLYLGDEAFPTATLQEFLSSIALGAFCSLLLCWALRFMAYRRSNRESIKVVAILIALISLLILCFFSYQLRMNPPQEIEEDVVLMEEPSIEEAASEEMHSASKFPETSIIEEVAVPEEEVPAEPVAEETTAEVEIQPFDVDAVEPEPECEIVEVTEIKVPQPPVPVLPPKAEVTEVNVAVPTAPQGLTAWSWLYDDEPVDDYWDDGWSDDWEDDWSEDDWMDDTSDDDFWADFFISGEDSLEFDDGLYYMNVFINGYGYGEWEVYIENEDPGLPADYLAYYLEGELIEEVWERIFFDEESPYVFLSHLEEIGITTTFDRNNYEIRLEFGPDVMPVRSISIAGASSYYKPKILTGAVPLEPAKFVFNTRYNLNVTIPALKRAFSDNWLNASLSLSNSFRIMDWYGSFSIYMGYLNGGFNFDFGSWTGNKDIEEKQLRLSYGNIGGSNSLGFRLDHDVNFGKRNSRSVITEYITIETESDVKVFNDEREIYRRRLPAGNYRLEDFTLFTGANRIRIEITPLDGTEVKIIDRDILYSTGMLMPGDYNYGFSVWMGKSILPNASKTKVPSGAVAIPWFDDSRIVYDFRDIGIRGYFSTGITPALSLNTGINLGNRPTAARAWNPSGEISLELTHANMLGTTRYSFSMREGLDMDGAWKEPGVNARIGHQTSFGNPYISSLNMNASYLSPVYSGTDGRHTVNLSLGTGGRLGIVSWNLSAYLGLKSDALDEMSYSASLSTTLLTRSSFTLSASINVTGSLQEKPSIGGRITGSVRFKGGSLNASTDLEGFSSNASAGFGRHAFRIGANASDILDMDSYTMDGSYSYSGDMLSFSSSFATKPGLTDSSLSLAVSTSSTFADGLLAIGANIPQNFLMISQKGAIKGNEVSVASIGSSSAMVLPSSFGVSLYPGISPYGNSSFTVYSTPEDSFGSSVSYDVSLVPRSGMNGYVLKLHEDPSFNVTGIVLDPDGIPWINGSSPLYTVDIAEDGLVTPLMTEDFVFLDESGRFIINELKAGWYGFDMKHEGRWIHVMFHVEDELRNAGKMMVYENSDKMHSYRIEDPYSGVIVLENTAVLEGDEFWAMLFPEF